MSDKEHQGERMEFSDYWDLPVVAWVILAFYIASRPVVWIVSEVKKRV